LNFFPVHYLIWQYAIINTHQREDMMDIKEAVMEALRTLIIPELDSIKERISVI